MTRNSAGPWTWRTYPSDTPPDQFGPLAPIAELWRAKWPQPGVFPKWRDFDIMEFEGWWGQLSLAETQHDPIDLKWVLWGTKITVWWGADYTNKVISEMPSLRDVWQNYERGYFEHLLAERGIGYVNGSLTPQNRFYTHICGIDLPLDNDDGAITHVLSAYALCEQDNMFVPEPTPLFTV